MKTRYAVLVALLALILALSSCASVQTSGAKDQNDKGNFERAIEMANMAIQKNPNDAEAHYQLGVAYSGLNDMAPAYREFAKAEELNPAKKAEAEAAISSNFQKHYESGMTSFNAGDSRGAAREFDMAAKADPRQVKAWLNLGKAYYSLSGVDSTFTPKVYATVDTLLARNKNADDPNYTAALAFEGRILAKEGKNAEAKTAVEALLTADPNEYKVAEDAGNEYLNKKNYQAAFDMLKLAVDARAKTNQEAFDPCYNLGAACLNMKDFPNAIDAFSDAVRLDPNNKMGRYYLLLAYFQGNQFDDAILVGEEFTKKYPDDPNGWRILSLSYKGKGMTLKAEEAAKKAAELQQ